MIHALTNMCFVCAITCFVCVIALLTLLSLALESVSDSWLALRNVLLRFGSMCITTHS